MRHFDLCVIGSGPAGQRAAIQAAKLGKTAVVIEKREQVGGVAINTGTIPSKALREAILQLKGVNSAMPTAGDFMVARTQTFTGLQSSINRVIGHEIDTVRQHFARNGVEVINGHGKLAGQTDGITNVQILSEHGDQELTADKVLIGVGTGPARPGNVAFDGTNIVTSDEIIGIPYLPNTMIVVGGGVIGTEYASMLTALGVRVTLVEGRPRLLDFVDGEIIEALQYQLRQAGATLRMGEKVVSIKPCEPPHGARTANGKMAEATLESGKTLRADCVLYAVGRGGATDNLGLDSVGLEADNRGRITVDPETYETVVPGIYAAGDVIGFPGLASTSMEQGRIAALRMFDKPANVTPDLLPFGIYSVPEISMVGWTEQRLTEAGIPFEAGVANYREIARGKMLGDESGMLKILVHQESRTILGVHAIGTGATELIHIGQCAIAFNATLDYFVESVFNYPTLAECYKVAAFNALNKLHGV